MFLRGLWDQECSPFCLGLDKDNLPECLILFSSSLKGKMNLGGSYVNTTSLHPFHLPEFLVNEWAVKAEGKAPQERTHPAFSSLSFRV